MKKYRVLQVGCGGMSHTWLDVSTKHPDLEIVGLVDLNLEAAQKRAEEFKLEKALVTTNYDEALSKLNPDIVFDCTVPSAHAETTIKALNNGCHVFGEKPLSDNLDDAQKMISTADKNDKLYAVIQNRRYTPRIKTVRDVLKSGKIGKLHTVNADFYIGAHFGGFRDEMDHVLLMDMAIHSFDQGRFLTDSNPLKVFCDEFNPHNSWYKHGASAMANFKMTDDITFNYRGSWCAEGCDTPWECTWRFIGDKGTLLWDGEDSIKGEVIVGKDGFTREREAFNIEVQKMDEVDEGHSGLIHEFVDCVKNSKIPQTHCKDNVKSLAMVIKAVESAENGLPIEIKI